MSFCRLRFMVLLVAAASAAVNALDCGTFFSRECKADYDVRYNQNYPVDLKNQSKAWSAVEGFYKGLIYKYDTVKYEKIKQTDFVDTLSGLNYYLLSPSLYFLNMTVDGTKSYRHTYKISAGRFGIGDTNKMPGGVEYCDGWSVATWEKDGTAQNLKSVCALNEGYQTAKPKTTLLDGSMAYPVDEEAGVIFIERFHQDRGQSATQMNFAVKCANLVCTRISVTIEYYEKGKLTLFEIANLTQVNSSDFTESIIDGYSKNIITERDQVLQPIRQNCLNKMDCPSAKDFCDNGDPYCTVNPYQEVEGDVRTGAIVTLVFGFVAFMLAVVLIFFFAGRHYQVKRYREFFAERIVQTMPFFRNKKLSEFSPEELLKEYKILKDDLNNREINKDNFYEFLSMGPKGYMDYGDFEALWTAMDKKKTGSVDFLEFCSIMVHCHRELEEAKLTTQIPDPPAGGDDGNDNQISDQ